MLTERLAFIVSASTGGAVKGLKEVASAAKDLEKHTDASGKELARLEARAAAAGNTLKSGLGLTALQSKLQSLGPVGQTVSARLDSITNSLTSIGPAGLAAGAGIAAGLGVLAKLSMEGVNNLVRLAGEVKGLQRVTGASAEDASKLNAALRATGTDSSVAERGFFLLSKTIENTPQKLAAVGVEVARNKDGSVDLYKTLENVAAAYQKAGKGAEGNAIAAAAFGRSGQQLLPILGKTRQELEAIAATAKNRGMILDQKDIDDATKYKIVMRDLGQAFQGATIDLGRGLLPVINEFASAERTVIDWTTKLTRSVGGIGGLAKSAFDGMVPGIGILASLRGKHDEAKTAADGHADALGGLSGAEDDAADATGRVTDRIAELAKAQEAAAKAALENLDATLSFDRAHTALGHTLAQVRDAQRKFNDAVAQYGPTSEQARDAALDLESAQQGLRGSILDVAKAYAEQVAPGASAAAQASAQLVALRALKDEFPQLRDQIEAYISELLRIPGVVRTEVRVDRYGSASSRDVNGHAVRAYAYGDIVTKPTLGVFGEAGPEMVLPLSMSKRGRAMQLLAKAGMLPAYANGGIFDVGRSALPATSTSGSSFTVAAGAIQVMAAPGREQAAARAVAEELERMWRNGFPKPAWANN